MTSEELLDVGEYAGIGALRMGRVERVTSYGLRLTDDEYFDKEDDEPPNPTTLLVNWNELVSINFYVTDDASYLRDFIKKHRVWHAQKMEQMEEDFNNKHPQPQYEPPTNVAAYH